MSSSSKARTYGNSVKSSEIRPRSCHRASLASPATPDTRLIAVSHASNVTGIIQPIRDIVQRAHTAGVPVLVDAAQTAGHIPIDVVRDEIDLLAASGHKGLLGPTGTGFLYVRRGLETKIRALKQGGTGSVSEELLQPASMPDRFESGTLNVVGIAGLLAAVIPLRPLRMPVLRRISPSYRRQVARFWSGWKARSCPASRRSKPAEIFSRISGLPALQAMAMGRADIRMHKRRELP